MLARHASHLVSLLALTLISACVAAKPVDSDDTGDSGDSGSDSGDTNGGTSATIQQIRSGEVAIGEVVTLDRVVVTSPHTQGDEGLFIQDPAGGPNSGLYVWGYDGVGEVYAEPGDEVSVTGSPADFYGWTEFVIDSPSAIVVTGQTDVPAPEDLGDGAGVNWDEYESVLVQLSSQTVESVNEYGTGLLTCGVSLDNGFVNLDFDCRAELPAVTGIVFYTYKAWSLNPRSEDDLGTVTTPEPIDVTIHDIQSGAVCGPVTVHGAIATSSDWSDDPDTYFTAQDEGGGEYTGITVFVKDGTYDVSAGDKLDITGTASEYYGLTELKVTDAADVVNVGTGTPVTVQLDEAPADWEPYESCLLTLNDVALTCTDPADNYGNCLTDWGITLDDELYSYPWADGMVYDSVSGLIGYSYSTWTMIPRDSADVVVH